MARDVQRIPAQPFEPEGVMAGLGRKLMWGLVGGVAMRAARGATRGALHTRMGAARLPRRVRRQRNLQTALLMAVGTGVVMAVADVLSEQGKTAARAAPPPERRK
jgi:hypothetical protein